MVIMSVKDPDFTWPDVSGLAVEGESEEDEGGDGLHIC